MQNLTTPQAILCGFALIALAIASIPYSSSIVSPARATGHTVQKVTICDKTGANCAAVFLRMGKYGGRYNFFLYKLKLLHKGQSNSAQDTPR